MPIQHSPPARQTSSQARPEAVLTATSRAALEGTPAVPQLRAQLDREPILEGAQPSRKEERAPEDQIHYQEQLAGFQELQGPFTEVLGKVSEPFLWAIIQKMTQIMANPQAASSSESSRPPAFKTPSMKAPECFDGAQPVNVRSFI
ncbi:hypothetical protein O181_009531 [Austropuccinia psidii MF-1]|uniref:Uncharacterized protein n=1 Tax=Austropuccinia psidii MF-1 TaxID=1389203 RepID=A0A9Q3BPG5_9BASI|nr:hypothetical protein [Austropuccinia psidii MF-1]